jgi:hypothetical protein
VESWEFFVKVREGLPSLDCGLIWGMFSIKFATKYFLNFKANNLFNILVVHSYLKISEP